MPNVTFDHTSYQAKYDCPLHTGMFNIAMPLMRGFQSDLAIDMKRLLEAKEGERYYWGVRDTGTHLWLLTYPAGPSDPLVSEQCAEHHSKLCRHSTRPLYEAMIVVGESDGMPKGKIMQITWHEEPVTA